MRPSLRTLGWIFLLSLTVACDDGGDTGDSDIDASTLVDAGGDDGGPTTSTVETALVAALGTESDSVPRLEHYRFAGGDELVLGFFGNSVRQPVGTELLGLDEERAVFGFNDGVGTPFRFLTYDPSEATGDRYIGDRGGYAWLHYEDGDPGWLGETRITGPVVVRWSHADGTTESWPVPAGLGLEYVGPGSDGEHWVLGWGDGATVVDGSLLGTAGTLVLFAAELDDGLKRPVPVASFVDFDGALSPDVVLLPSGELLLELRVPNGEAFGEAVSDYRALVRFDASTGVVSGEWELANRSGLGWREDEMVEIQTSITETTTIGDHTYEPFTPFGERDGPETWIRIVWDGSGDSLPEGERFAINPRGLSEAGAARVTTSPQLAAQLGADGSIVRWLSANNGLLVEATAFDGRIWAQVLGDGSAQVYLRMDAPDGSTMVPLESEDPERSFWLVELDPDTGAILRQKTFDVGPAELVDFDRREAFARPLVDGRVLAVTRPAGEAVPEIRIEGWADEPPSVISPVVTGTGCRASVSRLEYAGRVELETDPSVFGLRVRCESGPHTVALGEDAFEHAGWRSANLVRVD